MVLMACMVVGTSLAQDSVQGIQDTISVEGNSRRPIFKSPKDVFYHVANDRSNVCSIDTGLVDFQIFNPTWLNGFPERNTGNLGSPHGPYVFNPGRVLGFDLGYHQFDAYAFSKYNIRHYQTVQPYTALFLLIGLQQEQMASVEHAQTIQQQLDFGFHYRRFNSPGLYSTQQSRHNNLAITLNYRTKGGRYEIGGMVFSNNINAQANGGVVDTDLFDDGARIVKLGFDVELDDAAERWRDNYVILRQAWHMGRPYERMQADSTIKQGVYPSFTFFHEAELGKQKHRFEDNLPDEDYYGGYYVDNDTVFEAEFVSQLKMRWLANRVGFEKTRIMSVDSSGPRYANFMISGLVEHQVRQVEQRDIDAVLHAINLKAGVSSHYLVDSKWQYELKGGISFLGYNDNDVKIIGKLGYDFGKWGSLDANAAYQLLQPQWLYSRYQTSDLQWDNSFARMRRTTLGGGYSLASQELRLGVDYHLIENWTYWDTLRLPQQSLDEIHAVVITAEKNFRWGGFGWMNQVTLQFIQGGDILQYPTYFGKHSLYYSKGLFKDKLGTLIGFDVLYNSNFNGYGYFPVTGQFHLEEAPVLEFYPVIDLYLNLSIQTVRFFFKVHHINQGMFKENGFFTFHKYPTIDRTFQIGIDWRFYN